MIRYESAELRATVVVHMGDVVMEMPKSFFLSPPGHEGRDPDAVGFNIVALMPNFDPITPSNVDQFNEGWRQQILVGIYFKGYQQTGRDLLRTRLHSAGNPDITDGPFGYKYFMQAGLDDFFRGSVDNPTDIIICTPSQGPLSVPSPHCERIVQIGPEIVADYSFARRYLDQATEVDANLLKFVNHFRTSGPVLRIIK